jgi:CMP-N,N'-diacetyllegionaminic acid synthase
VKEILIIIPAKAASTRLKQKNMRLLGGKPLLQWAIDSAKEAQLEADILVSSESDEIIQFALSQNTAAQQRPEKLAVDPAGVVDVALHVLGELETTGKHYKTLIILLPTCPFRTAQDIQQAMQLYKQENAQFLMSVSEYSHTPFAAMSLDEHDVLTPFFPTFIGKKYQLMPKAYRANGAIHVLDIRAFQREKSYYAQPLIGYEMPPERSIDIDTASDLRYAEFILHENQFNHQNSNQL